MRKMTAVLFLSLAFLFVLGLPAAFYLLKGVTPALEAEPVTIFFVRHAETNDLECPDVEKLSDVGMKRARILAKCFDQAELTHVFSSHKLRTLQTVELVAAEHGLEVQQVPALPPGAGECESEFANPKLSIKPTIDTLLGLSPGSVALVGGHSSTIIPIMIGLGIPDTFPRDDDGNLLKLKGHDNLYVVIPGPTDKAETQMVHLRYADLSPAGLQ